MFRVHKRKINAGEGRGATKPPGSNYERTCERGGGERKRKGKGKGPPFGRTHLGGLEFHKPAPLAADLAELGRTMFHAAGDGVVRAGEESPRLELEVGVEILRVVAHRARIAQFEDHLSEEDAARVHIRHRQHVLWKRKAAGGHVRETRLWFECGGELRDLPASSGRPVNDMRLSPSIVVETELPRNLDFGRSSPTMATLFVGET
jgi:hypothetical protein